MLKIAFELISVRNRNRTAPLAGQSSGIGIAVAGIPSKKACSGTMSRANFINVRCTSESIFILPASVAAADTCSRSAWISAESNSELASRSCSSRPDRGLVKLGQDFGRRIFVKLGDLIVWKWFRFLNGIKYCLVVTVRFNRFDLKSCIHGGK